MDSIVHGADAALSSGSPQALHAAAIMGCACRLPGAADEAAFWSLLTRGACAVTEIPADRWSHERFLHPVRGTPGRAYTFAAGVLDDIFGFDAGAFGLSPREAEQIDPQQRLLLELVREAFEDANIPLSPLAGANVGVFVGASSLDHSLHFVPDIAAADAHFVTGNALSIIANRISHVFGFTGPSLTIDTACSSSLVAFDRAVKAIESGEVDTAVVAGVNILVSPFNFVGFSRAGMLSPTGRCRPFSGEADGYVRAEGGVVTVLSRLASAQSLGRTPRAVVMATGTNSDGRTLGIAMPESRAQQRLIEELYERRGIDPDGLAFIEAHGTGTLVGDPAEARAIGTALGRRRSSPLPIGSVKSNIGHLEPASGLAGLLKALNGLERRELPASLHLDTLNPSIDFEALNLRPAAEPLMLTGEANFAGISSFGFGGTNAHAVIRLPDAHEVPVADARAIAPVLMISATDPQSLSALAEAYADRLEGEAAPEIVAHAAAHGRSTLPHRLAIAVNGPDVPARLRRIAAGDGEAALLRGTPRGSAGGVAFVFTGNGGQYAGMGHAAWQASAAFRRGIEQIDAVFKPLAGWSLAASFTQPPNEAALAATETAQPLIFALQVSLARALMAGGCAPAAVIGHSVGEIAAAHICGALSLLDAVRLIYWRSQLQGRTRGSGAMAFLMASPEQAQALISAVAQPELVIGAINAPTGVTLSGPSVAIDAVLRRARGQGMVGKRLGLDYAFHSRAMGPLYEPIIETLSMLKPSPPAIPFISTVTGERIEDDTLDASYWWDNIRQPVQFDAAVRTAARDSTIGIFQEIGPKAVLTGFLREILADEGRPATVLASLQEKDTAEDDPVERSQLAALVNGAAVDAEAMFGPALPPARIQLPKTPWHRQSIRPPRSSEAIDLIGGAGPDHPLLGTRLLAGGSEWRGMLDIEARPFLADHKVGGHVVLPATMLAEMVLAAGRETLGTGRLRLEDFAILTALRLSPGESVETRVALEPAGGITVSSRARGSQEWSLHAQGRVLADTGFRPAATARPVLPEGGTSLDADALYAAAARLGLDYGPAFRLVRTARRVGADIDLTFDPPQETPHRMQQAYVLAPTLADAALHGLVLAAEGLAAPSGTTFLPVRFAALTVRDSALPVRAALAIRRASPRGLALDVALLDAAGDEIAHIEGVELRAVALTSTETLDRDFRQSYVRLGPAATQARQRVEAFLDAASDIAPADDALILDALAYAIAHRAVTAIAGDALRDDVPLAIEALVEQGRLAAERRPAFLSLLELLAEGGLACQIPAEGWRVLPQSNLPAPEPLLHEIAGLAPDRAAELAIGARLASDLSEHLRGSLHIAPGLGLIDQWESASPAARTLAGQVAALVGDVARGVDAPASVIVVERHGVLLDALRPLVEAGDIVLTVLPSDPTARPTLADRIRPSVGVFLGHQEEAPEADLILHFDPRLPLDPGGETARRLSGVLRPGGALVSFGFATSGFARLMMLDAPAGIRGNHRLRGARAVTDIVLLATSVAEAADHQVSVAALIALLKEDVGSCLISEAGYILDPDPALPVVGAAGSVLVWRLASGEDARTLAGALNEARLLLEALRAAPKAPALRLLMAGDPLGEAPSTAALWAFGRTAMNEYPDLDIRLIALDRPVIDEAAMGELARAVAGVPGERELVIDGDGLKAMRLAPAEPAKADRVHTAARLAMTLPGSLDRLVWQSEPRRAPGPGEVEIAVETTALNFRDVMFAQGLVGDDMLGQGFAGPTLGFECAGTVTRTGPEVAGLQPGDPVVAFAPGAFATHVTVSAVAVLRAPAGLAADAAATLPVAFLTAWYGLVHCARLEAGETVLIHGAAGGVGMAALQIARMRGARVVATAGTPEKRALAGLLGAETVYDSRSTAFAQMLQAEGGCDVVLNSLAGRPMELSLRALKPFGRFVELGKRDFVANTPIGLRPFARNLTYFGVDADQLIAARPALVTEMLAEIGRLFEAGTLQPLPYRVFAADEARAAFRLMQGSGHVGKILIRPPTHVPAPVELAGNFVAAAEGVHLVVGGGGGFGRETARWLAMRGARHVVVASRRGVVDPPLAVEGADIVAERLDVRDPEACAELIERLRVRHGRIAGVVHTAMVLDDALIRDLDHERFETVLGPKVDGARHLDAATAGLDLDYFVLFSSATTLVGNPGQAAYVAANAYLEGLARRRRREGRPGLAIAWGAISDAGVLARDRATSEQLSRRLGLGMLTAAEALDHLGTCLSDANTPPVSVHAPVNWRAGRDLAVMAGASFAALRPSLDDATDAGGEDDLVALIREQSENEARETVLRLLSTELGRILRLPPDTLDPGRALSDIGMDSLMGLELDLEMQRRHKVALPMLGLDSGATLQDIADRVLRKLRPLAETPGEAPLAPGIHLPEESARLIDRHLDAPPTAAILDALKAKAITDGRRDGGLLR
ncbi:acyl transferase domain-containing protein [Ancylobacter aquaticus]|uniref:Acyl transferase domain-containing protein n=1 Tax=Ancylobacter aquaticus TaxID=100 RepID=A0A4R1I9F7_ANCAQ|nr:type I polyketide synthase [Ancylobacter aquaticus]TCK30833.1 acyl transferase domain-containing protein [Ancylobacter aquaticus]